MPRSFGTTNVARYATAPPVGVAGDTYFNTTTTTLYISTGSTWLAIGPAAAASISSWKEPCRLATTAAITPILGGLATVDGIVTVAGDRVLVRAQAAGAHPQHGIYVVASGAWTRALDADTGAKLTGAAVAVTSGNTLGDTAWLQTTDPPLTIDATSVAWSRIGTPAEVNVSTAGPAPRVGELLWVDTDASPTPGTRVSGEYVVTSASMSPATQSLELSVTHSLGIKPSIIVGHLEDGSWAHQCTWRMGQLTTTIASVFFFNHGPNAAIGQLRFRLLY